MPALVVVGILVSVCIYGLTQNQDSYTINNVSFAAIHITLLSTACWPALQKPRARDPDPFAPAEVAA
jgi:type III secretory pathway component EscS